MPPRQYDEMVPDADLIMVTLLNRQTILKDDRQSSCRTQLKLASFSVYPGTRQPLQKVIQFQTCQICCTSGRHFATSTAPMHIPQSNTAGGRESPTGEPWVSLGSSSLVCFLLLSIFLFVM
jgi:hypothetical protein